MPGAYAKQLQGERYERLCAAVKQCERLLSSIQEDNSIRQLQREVFLLLLLVADYSKAVIEEFCYAGGFRLFLRIIQQRSTNPAFGDVSPLLRFFTVLMAREVDPYDNDLGVMPMLTYFLCERHTHYVDIEWNAEELTLMQTFLESLISFVSSSKQAAVTETDRVTAMNLIHSVLLSYPPHRVVTSAASVFNMERCALFFRSIEDLDLLWRTPTGRYRIAQLVFSIACFGIGPFIASDLPLSQLVLTLNSALLPELRCPCSRCEFFRRLQRAVRERDEFGVSKAADAKKNICLVLVQSGIVELLEKLLSGTPEAQAGKENLSQNQDSNDSVLILHSSFIPRPSPSAEVEYDQQSSETVNAASHDDVYLPESINCLHQSSDYVRDLSDPKEVADQSLRLVALTLWLCAPAYAEVHKGKNILCHHGDAVAIALLKTLKFNDLRLICDVSTLELLPGARSIIQLLCTLTLKAPVEDRRRLRSRLRPTIEALLERFYIHLIDLCGPLSRGWKPSMALLAPTQAIMLITVTDTDDDTSAKKSLSLSPSLATAAISATAKFQEGYEWNGTLGDERIFIGSVLASMAILTGSDKYTRCPERRRRFVATADPRTGFMASAARWFIQKFSDLSKGEGCVTVRTIGSLVISRAEKASAVISHSHRPRTTAEDTAISCF